MLKKEDFISIDVPADGNCLIHSILRASYKDYISNEDDNNYVEIPFGNIKIMLDTINKSKGYVTYQYYWPDKIYLLGAHMGSVGGRMVHQMIDIEFIKKLNI